MNPATSLPRSAPPVDVDALAKKLGDYFAPEDVHWRPAGGKPWNRDNKQFINCVAYIDARSVVERLNNVLGIAGWQDDYETLPQGEVRCRLSLKLGEGWITRVDVGSMSEQPDAGDRAKSAHSDALKRAAVKFGCGLYLYRLRQAPGEYDGKRVTVWPMLPTWAIPDDCLPLGNVAGEKLYQLLKTACADAKVDLTEACNRMLTRYHYAKGMSFMKVERRHGAQMLGEINEWITSLAKNRKSA